ncbi:placenta-specific protein 1-like [Heterocephalus glaber]|uniref:Placenta-specific protein 1-like n=1 Tax=Heterocephalus glaber TaxID=10181 RepID=A0AAX6S8H7_HETGA|nr:placenta-specific protein 1-like [Heterocephalus glaber]
MGYCEHLTGLGRHKTWQVVLTALPVPQLGASLGSGQMEVFLVSVKLLLLFSLTWTCSGDHPVYVRCSPTWFLVRVKQNAFDNNIPMAPGEVYLGHTCPVTSVHLQFYEFLYHTDECDIRTQVLPGDLLLFETEIFFLSMLSDIYATIPVGCIVPRHPVAIKNKGHNAHERGVSSERSGRPNLHIAPETINCKLESKIPAFKPAPLLFLHLSFQKQN